PLVIVADGAQPTAKGDLWGAALEAWKNGAGRVRMALNPAAVIVRAQLTSASSRASHKDGDIRGEHGSDRQRFQWPDDRWTLNRGGDDRTLAKRGRSLQEYRLQLSWHGATNDYRAVDAPASIVAELHVVALLQGDEWRDLGLRSKRAIARHLEDTYGG